jgi:hypothetical protein
MGAPLHPTTRADAPADAAGSATSIREEFDLAQRALFTGYRTAREGADRYRGGDPVGAASRRRVVARLQAVELRSSPAAWTSRRTRRRPEGRVPAMAKPVTTSGPPGSRAAARDEAAARLREWLGGPPLAEGGPYAPPSRYSRRADTAAVLERLDELLARRRGADRSADEVAALVLRRVIGERSPAADALLDYRDPPRTDRADRLAALDDRSLATAAALARVTARAQAIARVEFPHAAGCLGVDDPVPCACGAAERRERALAGAAT